MLHFFEYSYSPYSSINTIKRNIATVDIIRSIISLMRTEILYYCIPFLRKNSNNFLLILTFRYTFYFIFPFSSKIFLFKKCPVFFFSFFTWVFLLLFLYFSTYYIIFSHFLPLYSIYIAFSTCFFALKICQWPTIDWNGVKKGNYKIPIWDPFGKSKYLWQPPNAL